MATSFAYDALGRRVSKTTPDGTTVYVSSGSQEIAEYALSAVPGSPTRKFVYGSYIDEPLLMDAGGTKHYYHQNALYNVSLLTDQSGAPVEYYAYDAYGRPQIFDNSFSPLSVSAVGNPYLYTGRRLDSETGFYYYRARYYDYELSRFVGRDPIGYAAGVNLYG